MPGLHEPSATADPLGATAEGAPQGLDPHGVTGARAPDSGSHPTVGAVVARGTTLGRYLVIERLGAGGMGEVFTAFDPELDRRIALKLLRPDVGDGSASVGRARLMREAQAMAKLSHPNVIAVFDVGVLSDRVFVAMEFIRGQALGAWVKAGGHTQRAIVDMFIQAGRGLAAAHSAGLIHRDFKPDNVLVDETGRARVLDFGLARAVETAADAKGIESTMQAMSGDSQLQRDLTQAGSILGTPAYMAPEQFRGEPAGARTDQFSFCVSLYEALHGERPFAGDSFRALMNAVLGGQVRASAPGARVPARLRRVLLRGLQARPDDRFPSMESLLAALGSDPARVRRTWALRLGPACVAGLALFAYARSKSMVCRGADQRLVGVWDEARKSTIHGAFAATGLPFAEDVFRTAAGALDRYTKDWVGMRTSACEATARGEQSAELLDLRMQCLDQRLGDVRALTELFAHADARLIEKSAQAALGIETLGRCEDAERLRAVIHPPTDAATATRVAAIRQDLSRVGAMLRTAKQKEALTLAHTVAANARAVGYPPLDAEARGMEALALRSNGDFKNAETALMDTLFLAIEVRHDALALRALIGLVGVVGHERFEDGERWARCASAFLGRGAGDEEDRARFENNFGNLFYRAEKYEEATAHHRRSLELWEKLEGKLGLDLTGPLNGLGNTLDDQGKYEEALAYHRRNVAISEHALGSKHPDVAFRYVNLGNVLAHQGKTDEARDLLEHALSIQAAVYGPDHVLTAVTRSNLASLLLDLGKYDPAEVLLERSLAALERALGPDHKDLLPTLNDLGRVHHRKEDNAAARKIYLRVLALGEKTGGPDSAIALAARTNLANLLEEEGKLAEAQEIQEGILARRTRVLGPDHADVGATWFNLGNVLSARKKYALARERYERALSIWQKSYGPGHLRVSLALGAVALELVHEHQAEKAVPFVERALAIALEGSALPPDLAATRFILAQAYWDAGRDRKNAVSLAQESERALALERGTAARAQVKRVSDWLAAHRGQAHGPR